MDLSLLDERGRSAVEGAMARGFCPAVYDSLGEYLSTVYWIWLQSANAGKPGFNEYGLPLHACYGHKQDEHVAEWRAHRRAEV